MNSFYYASLTLEVVVRDRGSYNIYMTKIFQEVAVVFIRKYFFVSTNLANVFDRASPLNSFGFSTGKSLSEALLFGEHWENMLCTEIVPNVKNNFCIQHVLPMF